MCGGDAPDAGEVTEDQDMTFMDLEVPDYAYMFGFLQMDGHMAAGAGNRGRVSLEIAHADALILRRFQQLTPYPSSVRERTRATNFAESHHSATWTLCALEARNRLQELGLPYGKKSHSVRPPRVPLSRRDYVRGLIDADGSVGFTARELPFVALTSASTFIAAYLRLYARQTTGADRMLARNTRDRVYNVLYTREAAVELARDLYYPGALSLPRKHEAAIRVQEWKRPESMGKARLRRPWLPDEDRTLLRLGSPAAAAAALGRTVRSCSLRLWRLRTGRVAPAEAAFADL
jgi:hypothetical protein